jgi:hypothetical protein
MIAVISLPPAQGERQKRDETDARGNGDMAERKRHPR